MKKIDFSKPAERKQAVIWTVAGGWMTNGILIVQGFVLIPLYLHFLGDRLYGFWLATGGMLAWLSMADLGAAAVTLQRCAAAYGRRNFAGVISYFWHGLFVLLLVLTVVMAGILFIATGITSWLKVDPEFTDPIRICFIIAGAGVILRLTNDFLGNFAIALQRSKIPMLSQGTGDLLGLAGIVVALTVFEAGVYALAVGVVVRSLVPFAANSLHTVWILYSIEEKFVWNRATISDYVKTTPAVLAAKSCGQFSRNLPPVLLTRLIGPEAAVAYNITLRVIQVGQGFINQALGGFYSACSHFFSDDSVSPEKERQLLRKMVRGFLVASTVFGFLYALFNHGFVRLWTSESQFAGQSFTSLSALAAVLYLRGNLYVGLGMAMGRIKTFEFTQAVEHLLNAGLLWIAIDLWGVEGIPFAIIVASLAGQLVYQPALRRERPIVAEATRLLGWAWLPVALVFGSSYYLSEFFIIESWLWFVLCCGMASVPAGLVFLFGMPDLLPQLITRGQALRGRILARLNSSRLKQRENPTL